MNKTQPRLLPERIYEPNIIHNPRTWMGIWTPHGWRVHRKRFNKAQLYTVTLSGDGKTTFFPEALIDPKTGTITWQDDLHLEDGPFTDTGLYPADPRVEYPIGQPRWAISHTLLSQTVADHNLYTHQYTWDIVHGHLQTHFRKHVALEEARTDDKDGMTVTVKHKPIGMTIEGNVHYPLPNSAVRGVWTDPEKMRKNLYIRRIVQLISMHNGVYAIAPHKPVVQCDGMWAVLDDDPIDEVFDAETGECTDRQRLIEQFKISLDEPKIALLELKCKTVPSKVYESEVGLLDEHYAVVPQESLEELRQRMGSRCVNGRVGYAATKYAPEGDPSRAYQTKFDLNKNGIIDEEDEQRFARHIGREVRQNIYHGAYFGGDWLSTTICLNPEHHQGSPAIADYTYGGGYDGYAGVIRLLETPGPNKPVWVEYHYDAPAEPGENNILIHLYREE